MITRRLARALDRRLRLARLTRGLLDHVFPDHWSFMFGEIALYAFAILVITGMFLSLFFHASDATEIYHGSYQALNGVKMSAAYRSVIHLSFDVPGGLLIRQMHHWAALIFLGAIVAHLCRVFFTAAYRRPREINWVVGVTLLLLALINGYFGYSILGDLLSGTGLRIAYAILLSVPVVGNWLAYLVWGGNIPSAAAMPRMYALHIFVVPALITALIGLHLTIIWRQHHTNYPGPRRSNRSIVGSRLWPSYAAKSLGLFFLLFGVIAALGGLVQIDPVWVYGPYDPIAVMPGAQPDWYLGWVEGAMRLFPGVNLHLGPYLVPGVFFSAMIFPAIIFALLYAYPFLEELFSLDGEPHHVLRRPGLHPFNTAFGFAVLVMMLVLLFAAGDDVIAVSSNTAVGTIRMYLRILFFVAPALTFGLTYWLCARSRRRAELEAAAKRADAAPPSTDAAHPLHEPAADG